MDFTKIIDATGLIKDVSRIIVGYYGCYKYPFIKELKDILTYIKDITYNGEKLHDNILELGQMVAPIIGKEINYRPIIPKHIIEKNKIIYKKDEIYRMHKYTKRRNLPWPSSVGDSKLLVIGRRYHLHNIEKTYIQELNGKVDIYFTQWVIDSKSGEYIYEIKFKIY